MSLVDTLTPKNTEEIKPGLFIQKRGSGYRQVDPLAWDGKLRIKKQIRTIISFRTIITLAIIGFLVWSYVHDNQQCIDVIENPEEFCKEIYPCVSDMQYSGYGVQKEIDFVVGG